MPLPHFLRLKSPENGNSSSNARVSHSIGRLGNVVRENDEFLELISSKFLSDTRYSTSIQAAATRLLLCCSLAWTYPHVFEDDVLENIKKWVMEEAGRISTEDLNWKNELGGRDVSDSEMLRTYSTGLLAICLVGGSQLVEDVFTARLSAKLMRFLRVHVLGDVSQKDGNHLIEAKNASGASGIKVRDENRVRVRQVLETSHLDDSRTAEERSVDDQGFDRDRERGLSRLAPAEECWAGEEEPDGLATRSDVYEVDVEGKDRWHAVDFRDGRTKYGELDDNVRDDSTRHKMSRSRSRGKGRMTEGALEIDHALTSPISGNRWRSSRERSSFKNLDVKKVSDAGRTAGRINCDISSMERDDNDDCYQECRVGSKDISELVKKAVCAAEAEARAVGAPLEAIKAAGDSAAEFVKSAAFEDFKTSNDEEAAFLAASRAATTVIDAANATEVSRSQSDSNVSSADPGTTGKEMNEQTEDFFIPDFDSLTQLRKKYCIQCLEILGEYVEVLGPVLREKGIDVCLTLLQRSSKQSETLNAEMLLPDVMKLICALAAHRKFAALFVDRGGMQKLLAVPRVALTFFGLSFCLFTIGSLQGIMERVCALPSDVVYQVVQLAIQLLECPQDQARKNAALFFAAAFVFRAVLDAFDAQDGLQKLLELLNDAASVRSGVNSGALGPSGTGALRNDRSPTEVLTSSGKQIAYHTCVALRQYFRAHLLLLVESIRPSKSSRSGARNASSVRAAYKPLDISNEAMDTVLLLLQKDRKLGAAFVRTRWPAAEKFLNCNGHITMLELCQAPPVDRYLHDLLQYALGVLHIVTLVPNCRKMIVNATLSNNRVGIAVILDAASIASNFVDPEIIQPALNVLINLVCPPPSISNKPPVVESRAVYMSGQGDQRERNGESSIVDRGNTSVTGQANNNNSQNQVATPTSRLVGDRRISLGAGAGCAGLAAQLEQAYRQAREAVRANNGIKVLLHLLQPRIFLPPAALDCLRALACRVLLGLARDDTIAHILTKLQVGKKLSELIRDSGSQISGTEQGRWQAELSQVAIELISIVTNSGRASALAASDAATPTLRRIERAAIAAATPITYHSRELLLLIHEHLQASGLSKAAYALLKEARLTPLPLLAAPSSLASYQVSKLEAPSSQLQLPYGRVPCGFLTDKPKSAREEDTSLKGNINMSCPRKKPLIFSTPFGTNSKCQPKSLESSSSAVRKLSSASKQSAVPLSSNETTLVIDTESQCKTPIILPMKRRLSELKDTCTILSSKRLHSNEPGLYSPICPTSISSRKSSLTDFGFSTPKTTNMRDQLGRPTPGGFWTDCLDDNQHSSSQVGLITPSSHPGNLNDPQPSNSERLTLDSLVVQYLKHQHRQCPTPITTLPPLSLLQPHVCPEPKRSLDAPWNVTSRLGSREFRSIYGGVHGNRRDRQFVYSRFRPWRTCRDDASALLTCLSFLGDSRVAVGSHDGEVKIFDSNNNSILESCSSHQSPLTIMESYISGETQFVLSSSSLDVRLWDASSISGGPMHSFEGCKAARFSNAGNVFAALASEPARREILLYDIQTCQLELKLSDTNVSSAGRGLAYSHVHFSPSDTMLLWNGVLWDRREPGPVHRFDQFTDYGGGGFHPAGNEVIINSEVWDLRKLRLLRSVPSLDQTAITFNASGDVIYAILRRNLEDVMSAVHTRRIKHPLFAAFRTIDAVNYSDIATIPLDRCVLDFTTEETDSFVGLITMDDQDEMFSSARVYEIGRRRPTDDDSDPDDAESESEEDDDDDDDDDADDLDPILGLDIDGDGVSDSDMSNEDDDDSVSDVDDEDDGDFVMDDIEFGGGPGMLEIMTEGDDEEDDSQLLEYFSSGEDDDDDDDDFVSNGYGF
ncbi:DDB1- and CUL4-associated factor homolog 1-like isoform X2 [Cucurbita moschata]|uniref:DDB1- and CUL4-associated factor homolog 1-like isoform X2 n=1 Tax=Cucurbita moschata TaxID=3662 RepID=A0A6J1EDZ4_CUCMO|nr:DDB1- and CUL4-associated factor homolog 1-like isoform X2 [Cucurbita moschata]